jgi:hypothetical protein
MKRPLIVLTILVSCTFALAKDECQQTGSYKIYSNAFLSQATGDVVGHELALKTSIGNSYEALLYIYEGVPNLDGISLVGQRQGATISLEGDWTEELVEMPSRNLVTQTRHVKLKGRISGKHFQGSLQIDRDSSPISLQLTNNIWLCSPEVVGQRPTTNSQ